MDKIRLTARQIKFFDESSVDRAAAKITLKIALQYHSNIVNEITKREREMWDELAELHNLDLRANAYKTQLVDGEMCIKQVEPDDGNDNSSYNQW